MKKLITAYTFDKTAKTITFSGYATIALERVLLITNVTRNTIIYNFADASLGGSVATNVLTLTYNTSAMVNTDKLQIFYDDPNNDIATDASSNLKTNLAVKLDSVNDSITSYPFSHQYTYISTATTTTIKSDMGHLAKIIISETAAGAITIYDNTAGSGTIIGVLKASIGEGSYEFNVGFGTGLTIVTAGASKITVVWR